MPSLNNIVTMAESLEKSPMVLLQDSCVSVRNRHASCRRCVTVCPYDCITVERNVLNLRPLNCVNCGLCALVCPTDAIRPIKPTDIATAHQVESAWHANGGNAVIACARIASKREADPSLFAQIPCLGHIHEGMLLEPLAEGATRVTLVDGDCSSCKYGFVNDLVDHVVDTANDLLDAQGIQPLVARERAFPSELLVDDTTGMYGSSRRAFFSGTVKSAREMAVTAADSAIKKELGAEEAASIGERLRVSDEGTLPIIAVPRHDTLLNALFSLGERAEELLAAAENAMPAGFASAAAEGPMSGAASLADSDASPAAPAIRPPLDTRLFAQITIEPLRCNQCGMCAVFCPTHALRRALGSSSEALVELEFSVSDCVQCGLCVDVSWKRSIALDSLVELDDIFDFEPRIISLLPPARD